MKIINYKITRATNEQYDDYYKIRSEKTNLFWTGYENPPDYKRFFDWYIERLKNPDRDIHLLYIERNCAGSLHIDYYEDYAAIGYNVKENFEGKGLATIMVRESIAIVKEQKKKRENIRLIKAWINSQNIASERVVVKNGFHLTPVTEKRVRFGNEEIYHEYVLEI